MSEAPTDTLEHAERVDTPIEPPQPPESIPHPPPTSPSTPPIAASTSASAAEGGEKRPTVMKGGVGRPRADGAPKKTDKPSPMPVPAMPYKRYFTNNPNATQQPAAALSYINNKLPEWAKKQLLWYVERDWPVLLHISKDDKEAAKSKGEEVEHNYIDKFADPIQSTTELLDRYGAGDYHLTVNDAADGSNNRTICEIWVRENWHSMVKSHPPSDRRIDDPGRNLDMDDKSNNSYILYLRSQGKLPGQIKEQVNMAEVTAVTQAMGMTEKLMDRVLDDKNNARPDDTMATVVKGVVDVMTDTMKRSQENLPKPQDPMETVKSVLGMMGEVDKMRTAAAPPPMTGESQLVSTFMTQIMEMNKTIQGIQSERIASTERLLQRVMDERANSAGGGGGGNGKTVVVDGEEDDDEIGGLGKFLKIAEMLGFKKPGGGAVTTENPGIDYKEMIPEIIKGVATLGDLGLRAWQTKVMYDAAMQGRPINNMPQPAQPPPQQPQQQQQQHQALPPDMTQQTQQPAEEEETMQLTMFLRMIENPFLNHFHDGLGGAAFANWLIDGYKRSTYDQIREQGPQIMKMILLQYPPIANSVKDKEKLLDKFIEEFCDEAKVNAFANGDDMDEGEGEGGEGVEA